MSDNELKQSEQQPKRKRTLFQKTVNVFLYIGIVFLGLLIFLFGFSQTQTFRNWLRDFVVATANENLNGTLSIGKIEGTIFTSLILRDAVVTMNEDTLLNAGKIEVRTSPLRLFLKKIYVRKAEIKDAKVSFVADSLGELNVSKLFPPSEEEDTTTSHFPFRIEVADFNLTNVSFSLQRYDLAGSENKYQFLNMNDFRVNDIFLSLKAFADIDNNIYELKINHLSLTPNLVGFNLKSLSGEFGLSPKEILINNLTININNSEIELNTRVEKLNIFDSTFTENLNEANLDLSLSSSKLNFGDVTAFVPSIDMLKGAAGIQVQASGNLRQLDVNKIVIEYEKTRLETKAVVRNVDDPDNLTISSVFKNSYVNQPDISKLLPEYGIPVFDKLGLIRIDSLTFDGKPLNFKSNLVLSLADSKIFSIVKMNLEESVTEYEINLSARNFNLAPIANLSSKLNINADFIGRGFSPEEMNTSIKIVGDGSEVEQVSVDFLSLNAQANQGILEYSLNAKVEGSDTEIFGTFDLLSEKIGYKANGLVRALDFGKLSKDTTLFTNLNFSFKTEGEDFDIDKMNMYLTLDLFASSINNIQIDSIRTITDVFTDNNDLRVINFISDIADITIKGNFLLSELIGTLNDEINLLSNAITNKISEFLPAEENTQSLIVKRTFPKGVNRKTAIKRNITSVAYLIDLKDFGIISPFLKDRRFEVDGDVGGTISYDSDSIYFTCNSNFNYLKYLGGDDVFFIAKLNSELKFQNSFQAQSSKELSFNVNAKTKRVFAGSDLNNISFNFSLNHDMALINLYAKLEDYAYVKFNSLADLRGAIINFEIDTLDINYNGFDLTNKEKLNLVYSPKRIDVNKFKLFHADGEIEAEGFLSSDIEQILSVNISNIKGKDLIQSFSNSNGLKFIDINLNLRANISGNYLNPIIKLDIDGQDLTFKNKIFGSIQSGFYYADKNLSIDVKFFDSFTKASTPSLSLFGNIPINLSFTDTAKTLIDDKYISLNLYSKDFDLTPFGEIIPGVSKFKGKLNCDLKLVGTIQEPLPDGFFSLDNASFRLIYNNLEYNAGIKISFGKDIFSLDSLVIANTEKTVSGGKIIGSGQAKLKNLNMISSEFAFNGTLKVLSEESKYVSPNLFGDLVISTNGNFDLSFDKSGAKLRAPINIEVANLTYSQPQSYYSSGSENFIYRYVEDTIITRTDFMDFEDLINLSRQRESEKRQQESKLGKFDYRIDVTVEDEAILTYILSREFNQDLTAILRGNFRYESISGNPVAQGELTLLEGSTLEFIKTFTAEGKIRFESQLANPYLDITAIYKNYYYPIESSTNGEGSQSFSDEVEVAIKMNIKGVLNELDKNLSQQSEKLTVYVGTKNIEENIPDPTKDASDAVMFMLLGKFNDNITQQERNIVSAYATSFAGSLVGGFLNRQLGDVVKSLEIRQSGTDTKFILAGRAGKFRYSIGGSTAVFQDLGLANVKIEYPISRSFFMRLERKEALSENKYVNEMINEVGLKYRFEF